MEKLQSPRPVVITGVAQTFWRSLLVFPTTTQGLEWEAKLDRPRPQRRDLAPSPEVSETATHRSPPLRRPRLLSAKPPPLSEAPPTPPAELLQLPGFRSCGRRTASYPGPDSGPSGQAHWTWSSDQLSLIFWDQLRAFLIPSSGDSSLQTAECRDSMKARIHQKRTSDVITDSEPPCGCWDLNSGPLEEQSVLLTAEPSLQPLNALLK
ncbi:alpha-N-acetyl-neuraminyl-2,3-beta-galactosyl-1,3-N-acetyl-galactosaminide alpha-2,6-sialyltransferase isoform X5 [Rattus norvegicus]|uniref:alpha-N-acetyl-neuraminyl-2,3-beta-galactosyl-1, 3-N-acetyl-galactosaminide alpha-2,6-sialyltransferase isoform X5 n=1 Tax=Rattus norvegicus TaxID=10116 RepID=UPI002FD7C9CA